MANAKISRQQKPEPRIAAADEALDNQRHRAGGGNCAVCLERHIASEEVRRLPKRSSDGADSPIIAQPFSASRSAPAPWRQQKSAVESVAENPATFLNMSSVRLFIASLGNPSPYQTTRHSAGHVMLKALQSHLKFPSLKKSKIYANGFVSIGAEVGRPEFTLWQSPSYMNVSGKDLLKAYKQFVATTGSDAELPGLIVLHDEMETTPGQLKARSGNLSARGHNGIKSVQQSLQSAGLMSRLTEIEGGSKFIKIGIGIGRPAGGTRDKDDVSSYVLGKFGVEELANLAGNAAKLEGILEDIRMKMGT